ncbi:hypothetical protein KGA66_22305, partial [Actinocrinis puniceicyclus]
AVPVVAAGAGAGPVAEPGAAAEPVTRPCGVAPPAATPGDVAALVGADLLGMPGIGKSAPGGIGPPRKLNATATP